jgi:hypothetical protein|tara:strand:+ start:834 stop:1418 length:585 start_codon:yes stop_codon:yes gene_type:complete
MIIPEHIFFTGVPGSRWSGIAQTIETIPGFNTSDRTPERSYDHHAYSGHKGAYFGKGMEFDANLNRGIDYINQAWPEPGGHKLVKSHNWAYFARWLKINHPHSWVMLVYRSDLASYTWWHEAGGFQIKYPCYDWYENSAKMMMEIQKQNTGILEYAYEAGATWEYFTPDWIEREFGHAVDVPTIHKDILVTIIK